MKNYASKNKGTTLNEDIISGIGKKIRVSEKGRDKSGERKRTRERERKRAREGEGESKKESER